MLIVLSKFGKLQTINGQFTNNYKDLARQLNISVSTVSRALRNASDINQETKSTVLVLA